MNRVRLSVSLLAALLGASMTLDLGTPRMVLDALMIGCLLWIILEAA
jgi:hypothetical protein